MRIASLSRISAIKNEEERKGAERERERGVGGGERKTQKQRWKKT